MILYGITVLHFERNSLQFCRERFESQSQFDANRAADKALLTLNEGDMW
jgi:hypothetical protein